MSSKTSKFTEIKLKIKEKKENAKNNTKRLKNISITFQISAERLMSNMLGGVLVDIAYIALMSCAVVYNAVQSAGGCERLHFFIIKEATAIETLRTASLNITIQGGRVVTENVGNYAVFLAASLLVILAVQFISLIAACVIIPGRTYERLKPLFAMTEAAKKLKNIDIVGSDYTTLESAISELSPNSAELEIHTGKEELAGLEDAINDLLQRTRASYQSQIRFVSDASHELRTPIAVIQGYANMLERWGREDKEILDESISSIKSESENMSRLIENLLFLARGDSGRAIVRPEKLDINRLICEIYDEFVMIDTTHEFQLDLRADIEATADPSLLKQCLRILVDNAIKYSPEGTDIILRLQNRDKKYYAVEVQDNGIGIKSDEVDKIFERFYRSDPARNRQSGGCGLGLSIAKWIADKHGGFFEVLSYEKLGTRISLVLPFDGAAQSSNTSSAV